MRTRKLRTLKYYVEEEQSVGKMKDGKGLQKSKVVGGVSMQERQVTMCQRARQEDERSVR